MEDRPGSCPALQPVPARTPLVLEFTIGTPYLVRRLTKGETDEAFPVALVGPQSHRRVDLVLSGQVENFIIVFEPGGFSALFSMPAAEIANQDVDASAALGRELTHIRQRLGDAGTFADRAQVLDSFLGARLAKAAPPSAIVSAARKLHDRDGRASVVDLAAAADLSVRQFERRFQSEMGLPPKLYARIVRFEGALRLKTTRPRMPWTEIAHTLGYFDQMHMVHDFNRLSGGSPSLVFDQLELFAIPELETSADD